MRNLRVVQFLEDVLDWWLWAVYSILAVYSRPGSLVRGLMRPRANPMSIRSIERSAPADQIRTAVGTEVLAIQVWSESNVPCEEHCWHEIETKRRHRENLGLSASDQHYDFVCCHCTHALCHSGKKHGDLEKHPLKKFHRRNNEIE
jgi:hypothetical protein